jgi:hypothetical protein
MGIDFFKFYQQQTVARPRRYTREIDFFVFLRGSLRFIFASISWPEFLLHNTKKLDTGQSLCDAQSKKLHFE